MGRRPLGLGCTCLTPWSFETSVCCRQGCVGSSPGPVRSRSRLTYSRALDTEKAFGPSAATDSLHLHWHQPRRLPLVEFRTRLLLAAVVGTEGLSNGERNHAWRHAVGL